MTLLAPPPFPLSASDPQGNSIWLCFNIPCPAPFAPLVLERGFPKDSLFLLLQISDPACWDRSVTQKQAALAGAGKGRAGIIPGRGHSRTCRRLCCAGLCPTELFCRKHFTALGSVIPWAAANKQNLLVLRAATNIYGCRGSPPFFFNLTTSIIAISYQQTWPA